MLDSEEYLHLAIHATQTNQHHAALEYLHKSLELSPENPIAIFLLSAEYAELGLYNRAIAGMEKTIELDPNIEMAFYQLALLYMQQGLVEKCPPLWEHLKEESQEACVRLFSEGMLLLDENKEEAVSLIIKASETPTSNTFLQKSIESIRNNIVAATNDEQQSSAPEESSDNIHALFLNVYKDSKFSSDDN